jgi:hypothetical protein
VKVRVTCVKVGVNTWTVEKEREEAMRYVNVVLSNRDADEVTIKRV